MEPQIQNYHKINISNTIQCYQLIFSDILKYLREFSGLNEKLDNVYNAFRAFKYKYISANKIASNYFVAPELINVIK